MERERSRQGLCNVQTFREHFSGIDFEYCKMMRKFLGFLLSGEEWLIDIENIIQVIHYEEPTPIPGSPSEFEGIVSYKGEALSLVDITAPLGKKLKEGKFIIVMRDDDGLTGFRVDGLTKLHEFKDEEIKRVEGMEFIVGEAMTDTGRAFILDGKKILDHIFRKIGG